LVAGVTARSVAQTGQLRAELHSLITALALPVCDLGLDPFEDGVGFGGEWGRSVAQGSDRLGKPFVSGLAWY